jgi:hypothetical protein
MRGVDKLHSLYSLAGAPDPLGADFREVGRHGQLARIDGVKAAFGSDTS